MDAIEMTQTEIENLITDALDGRQYNQMYPAANSANVLSISRLAWSVDETIKWKMGTLPPFELTFDVVIGKATGEYVQNQLEDKGWIAEKQIEICLPFKWRDSKLDGIILMGHIDLYNPKTQTVIELKTSRKSSTIGAYAVRQCAMYAYATHAQHAYVVKINDRLNVYELTKGDIEMCVRDMTARAYKVAKVLNGDDELVQ